MATFLSRFVIAFVCLALINTLHTLGQVELIERNGIARGSGNTAASRTAAVERTTTQRGATSRDSVASASRGDIIAQRNFASTKTIIFKVSPEAEASDLMSRSVGSNAGVAERAVSKAPMLIEGSAKRSVRWMGKNEALIRSHDLHLYYKVDVDISDVDKSSEKGFSGEKARTASVTSRMEDAMSILRSAEGVTEVYEEAEKRLYGYQPTDSLYQSRQRGHYGAINLFENGNRKGAWDYITGNSDVIVQVVDEGLDMFHEEFGTNYWVNPLEDCFDGVDNDDNGFIDDCFGYNHADDRGNKLLNGAGSHGNHCSGTIAAAASNAAGVVGIAGGKLNCGIGGARIMTSTVFGVYSTGGFDEALAYGAVNGAHITSHSWYTYSSALYSLALYESAFPEIYLEAILIDII